MRQFNVMFGFAQEKTEETIVRSMNAMGLSVMAVKKTKKGEIFNYLKENPDTDAVILKEYLDGGGELGPQDLIELSDDNRVNFVIVLDAKHRGRDEMKDYYAAGILNACFSDNKYGANADTLAELAVRGRTHREAREYYRIEQGTANHRFLSYTEFKELYSFLMDEREGLNIPDRFITLSRWVDEEQLGSFIKMLPDKTREELTAYREFVEVNNRLYRLRFVDDKYSVGKTSAGISKKEVARKMVEESKGRTMPLPEPNAVDSSGEEKKSEPQEEIVIKEENNSPEPEADLRSMVLKARMEMEKSIEESATDNEETSDVNSEDKNLPEGQQVERKEEEPEAQAVNPDNEVNGKPVERKKNPFSMLKDKIFDPERGTVTVEEEPVIVEDLIKNGSRWPEPALSESVQIKDEKNVSALPQDKNPSPTKDADIITEETIGITEPLGEEASEGGGVHNKDMGVSKDVSHSRNAETSPSVNNTVHQPNISADRHEDRQETAVVPKTPARQTKPVDVPVRSQPQKAVPVKPSTGEMPAQKKGIQERERTTRSVIVRSVVDDKIADGPVLNERERAEANPQKEEVHTGTVRDGRRSDGTVNERTVRVPEPVMPPKPERRAAPVQETPATQDVKRQEQGKKKKREKKQIEGQVSFDDILNRWA